MSSSGFVTPISLRAEPSRILTLSLTIIHLGAVLLLPHLSLPGIAKIVLLSAIVVSLIVSIRSHVLLKGRRVVKHLTWPSTGSIRIEDGVGRMHHVAVAQDSVVHPWFTLLILIDGSKRRFAMLLLPDSGDKDILRCLRTRMLLDRKTT